MTSIRPALFVTGLLAITSFCTAHADAQTSSAKGGWQPLFDGKTLNGWYVFLKDQNEKNKDPNHLVQIEDGAIHMYKDTPAESAQPFGYIATEKEYANYHLRLQYKWGEKKFAPRTKARRDAGLLYHLGGNDQVWPRSVECQIQENDVGDFYSVVSTRFTLMADPNTTNIVTTFSTNRTTGVIRTNSAALPVFMPVGGVPFVQGHVGPSLRGVRNPMAERDGWNTVEIIVRGDSAVHIVNGVTNNACTHIEDGASGAWVPLTRGKIGLQLEGSEILYRNIEIQELKD